MKVTLLGTGSPVPMPNRASSGYLVEVGKELLLFDHGAGAHENFLRSGNKATAVNTLFLSHLHSDHMLDYARLVHSRWDQGAGLIPELTVYGPAYTARMSELLFGENGVFDQDIKGRINAPGSQRVFLDRGGTLPRKRPAPKVAPLSDGQVIETDAWKVTVREMFHQPGYIEAFGFRLETDAGTLVYSGDTGPCEAITAVAQDADMLIHMCHFISGTFQPDGPLTASGHMEIARLAAEANVKTLVPTHFTPQFEPPGVRERCIAEMTEVFKGRIVWGEDMMELTMDPPRIEVAK